MLKRRAALCGGKNRITLSIIFAAWWLPQLVQNTPEANTETVREVKVRTFFFASVKDQNTAAKGVSPFALDVSFYPSHNAQF